MDKPTIVIKLEDFSYSCSDGCCDTYGTKTFVNGIELESLNYDRETIIQNILTHLGYDVIMKY